MEICGEEIEPGTDPALLESGSGQVLVHLIDLTNYQYKEVCIKLDQIVACMYSLNDI